MKTISQLINEARYRTLNIKQNEAKRLSKTDLGKKNFKKFYHEIYDTDPDWTDLNPDITLGEAFIEFLNGADPYEIIGVYDSIFRERLFEMFAELTGVDYDDIYNHWMAQYDNNDKFVQLRQS